MAIGTLVTNHKNFSIRFILFVGPLDTATLISNGQNEHIAWHGTYLGDDFGHGLLELLGGGLVQRCGRGRVGGHCSRLMCRRRSYRCRCVGWTAGTVFGFLICAGPKLKYVFPVGALQKLHATRPSAVHQKAPSRSFFESRHCSCMLHDGRGCRVAVPAY